MQDVNHYWYAVYTRPRWEKKLSRVFEAHGITYYCPLKKVISHWSDRKKLIMEPVFRSYIFVKIREDKKWEIKKFEGVLNYVYWLGKPARIREEEIIIIQKFLKEFSDVTVENKTLLINARVKVKQGVLMNYEGMVLEIIGNRAMVKIDSMDLQLSAQFDKTNLESLQPSAYS